LDIVELLIGHLRILFKELGRTFLNYFLKPRPLRYNLLAKVLSSLVAKLTVLLRIVVACELGFAT